MAEVTTNELTDEMLEKRRKKEQSLFRKLTKNKLSAFALVIILLLTLTAIVAPLLAPFHPNKMDVTKSLWGAGEAGHLLGTDNYGRDILSRVIYGSRISLIVGVSAVLFGAVFGTRSEEHTSELQSRFDLVCRLLLEKKKKLLYEWKKYWCARLATRRWRGVKAECLGDDDAGLRDWLSVPTRQLTDE